MLKATIEKHRSKTHVIEGVGVGTAAALHDPHCILLHNVATAAAEEETKMAAAARGTALL